MPRPKKQIEELAPTSSKLMPESVLMDEKQNKKNHSIVNLIPWILIVVVVLFGALFFVYQNKQANNLKKQLTELKQNPQKATEDETKILLDKVGQLIELPNEKPTIATVTDPAILKDQPFFTSAQKDDVVIIYTVAKKAILFRPSTNKIIEVAPVNLGTDSTTNKNANTNSNTGSKPSVNSNKSTNTSTNKNSNN